MKENLETKLKNQVELGKLTEDEAAEYYVYMLGLLNDLNRYHDFMRRYNSL